MYKPLSINNPVTIVPDATAVPGSSTTASPSDHTHAITAASPSATFNFSSTNSEGAATSFARSDHSHAFSTPGAPADVTKASASAGVATAFARADHKHDISTASVANIGTANTEGSATSIARSDHVHALTFATVNTVLGTANASIDINNQKIINLLTPTLATDAVNKAYVDGYFGGQGWAAVLSRGNTSGVNNPTISSGQYIDYSTNISIRSNGTQLISSSGATSLSLAVPTSATTTMEVGTALSVHGASIGTTVAASGDIRVRNGFTQVARNLADSADLTLLACDTSNNTVVGNQTGATSLRGNSLVQIAVSGTPIVHTTSSGLLSQINSLGFDSGVSFAQFLQASRTTSGKGNPLAVVAQAALGSSGSDGGDGYLLGGRRDGVSARRGSAILGQFGATNNYEPGFGYYEHTPGSRMYVIATNHLTPNMATDAGAPDGIVKIRTLADSSVGTPQAGFQYIWSSATDGYWSSKDSSGVVRKGIGSTGGGGGSFPGYGSVTNVGTANNDGASSTVARADHVHALSFTTLNSVLGTANASVSVNSQKITNLLTPTLSTDATTKAYVDGRTWANALSAGATSGTTNPIINSGQRLEFAGDVAVTRSGGAGVLATASSGTITALFSDADIWFADATSRYLEVKRDGYYGAIVLPNLLSAGMKLKTVDSSNTNGRNIELEGGNGLGTSRNAGHVIAKPGVPGSGGLNGHVYLRNSNNDNVVDVTIGGESGTARMLGLYGVTPVTQRSGTGPKTPFMIATALADVGIYSNAGSTGRALYTTEIPFGVFTYTALPADELILVDNSSGMTTITLPNISGLTLRPYYKIKLLSSEYPVQINFAGGFPVDGYSGNIQFRKNQGIIELAANQNTNVWHVVGKSCGTQSNIESITSVTGSPYTVADYDEILAVNTSAARTINLPNPVLRRGFLVKDISGTAATNNMTLARFGSESIDGVAGNKTLAINRGAWYVWSNGTDYFTNGPS